VGKLRESGDPFLLRQPDSAWGVEGWGRPRADFSTGPPFFSKPSPKRVVELLRNPTVTDRKRAATQVSEVTSEAASGKRCSGTETTM
jgi:hypothetical protein